VTLRSPTKRLRVAGCATLVVATIVGAAGLVLGQQAPSPHAAAGIAIAPIVVQKGSPAPNPRLAHPGERIGVVPIDQLKGDESFDEFRGYLEDAIKRRDAQAIYRVVARDFATLSMDEDIHRLSPFEQFKQTAHLEDTNPNPDIDYWRTMDQAVRIGTTRMGYARLGTVYCGPALTTTLDDPDEPGDIAFVIDNNVPMRQKPDPLATQIASLSWEVIQTPNWTPPDTNRGYVRVVRRGGKSGWIERRFLRLSYEPAVCFRRDPRGDWGIAAIDTNED